MPSEDKYAEGPGHSAELAPLIDIDDLVIRDEPVSSHPPAQADPIGPHSTYLGISRKWKNIQQQKGASVMVVKIIKGTMVIICSKSRWPSRNSQARRPRGGFW